MTNLEYVLLGASFIAISAGIVGVWLVLRKEALRSDVVTHSVLPGIGIAFLLFQEKKLWLLLLGAFVTSLLSLVSLDTLSKHTRLKKDTLMALVLSFFFACGLWLLVKIQESKNASKTGLGNFIFGKMASILPEDILFALIVLFLVALINFLTYRWLFFTSFDRTFSESIGVKTSLASFIVTFMSILTIVVGIQAVGVVMLSALLIIPSTIAIIIEKKNLSRIFVWSIGINILVIVIGTILSYSFPKTPTGAWIVVICFLIALVFFLKNNKK